MELNKLLSVIFSITLAGCITPTEKIQNQLNKGEIYEQGYRQGVAEKIEGIVEESEGHIYSSPTLWHQPVVQFVEFEAQIKNGMYYRKHTEPVIIVPGQWNKIEAPTENIQKEEKVQNEKKNTYEDNGISVSNITVLPTQRTGKPSTNSR